MALHIIDEANRSAFWELWQWQELHGQMVGLEEVLWT